jgi:alpha-aminoadipate carrier protein LysW
MVNCPLCDAVIDVDEEELDEGDSLICEECGANLNVSGVSPLELVPDGVDEDDEEDLDDLDEDDEDADEEDEDDDEDKAWK